MIYEIKIADLQLNNWEKQAKRLVKKNAKLHSELHIQNLRWLGRTDDKKFSTLIIETNSAEHANHMICKDIIMNYDLKIVER